MSSCERASCERATHFATFAMMQVYDTPPVIVNRHHLETPPPSTDKVICERPLLRFFYN